MVKIFSIYMRKITKEEAEAFISGLPEEKEVKMSELELSVVCKITVKIGKLTDQITLMQCVKLDDAFLELSKYDDDYRTERDNRIKQKIASKNGIKDVNIISIIDIEPIRCIVLEEKNKVYINKGKKGRHIKSDSRLSKSIINEYREEQERNKIMTKISTELTEKYKV